MKNDDNRCIEWALKSALYPAKSNVSNKYTYAKYNLNLEGIVDFPTPISQISKVEKHLDLAINVYGYTVSKKLEKINIFPYHISEQQIIVISQVNIVVKYITHNTCNLKLKIKPYETTIPVVFHNLKGYGSHFIMQKYIKHTAT